MKIRIALVSLVPAAAAAAGTLHDVDVILRSGPEGVETHEVVSGGGTAPERVFDADMISFFGNIATEDPGFQSPLGEFTPFAVLSLDLVDPLRVWDGDAFVPVDPEFYLEIEFNNQIAQSPASAGTVVTGPLMNTTQFGDLHNHPDHFLFVEAEPGIYLGSFMITSETLGDSEPFYFVYRWEPTSGDIPSAEMEQQIAIEWVRENVIADPCPTDLDGVGSTGSPDLGALLAAWGGSGVDFDGDGVAGSGDLGILLASWGTCE